MYDIKKYPTEVSIASEIGKIVGKKIGYKYLQIFSSPDFQEVQFLRFQNEKAETKYFPIFIALYGNEWKVSAVGMIVDDDCCADLTQEEREKLLHFGTTYTYRHKTISMCDITNVDIDTVVSYLSGDASPDAVVISKAETAKRKKVSDIISDWFETERFIKNLPADADTDNKQFASAHNMRTDVVEMIIQKCMEAKRCVRKNVSYNGSGTDVKVTAALLSKDNKVYTLFLSVDEVHTGVFYMEYANGGWRKKLLPDSIAEVADLFMEKTR